MTNPERFNVDFRTYEFIAVLPSGRIHFMRTDVKPGIKSAADVIKGEDIVVGGLQRDGPKDMAMRLTLDMLGARYTLRDRLQFERPGDDRACSAARSTTTPNSPPLYKTKIEPQVKAGTLIPVFYDPSFDGHEFSVPLYMKDYPIHPFHELYKSDQRHDADRASSGRRTSPSCWSMAPCIAMIALPPGAPQDAVDRACARRSCNSRPTRAIIDEAIKVMGDAPEYVTSATLNDDVRKGLSISPELKAFMDAYGKRAK